MKVLIVIGFVLVGAVIPEFFVALSPKVDRAPTMQNIVMAIACGLISAGMVF